MLRSCITVLLVAALFSLTSIVFTPKTHAQVLSVTDSVLATQSSDVCPTAQFLAIGNTSCKPFFTPVRQIVSKKEAKPTPTVVLPIETLKPTEITPTEPIPTLSEQTPTATLSADVLFDLVNSHRAAVNLPPFSHDGAVCAVAESRRDEIAREVLVTHALHSGFYAKNLPYWATENLIWQKTEAGALNWWLHSPVHRAAIEGNYKYACGVCNGEVCNMVFTNYEQKVVIIPTTPTPSAADTSVSINSANQITEKTRVGKIVNP